MNKEQLYKLMKEEGYLPGSMRYRVGSLNEHQDKMDTIRFTTPDGRACVVEYHTFEEGQKTFSDVYDITEITPSNQLLNG